MKTCVQASPSPSVDISTSPVCGSGTGCPVVGSDGTVKDKDLFQLCSDRNKIIVNWISYFL